jgi:glycine cleavage system H lipoate-binding protein
MTVIEKFLGKRVEIPGDLHYSPKQGLWAKQEDHGVVWGLSEPALVLNGGIKDLEYLVSERQHVNEGDAVLFAITAKILYVDAPMKGIIYFNSRAKENPSLIAEDPYHAGWLFRIVPEGEGKRVPEGLNSAEEYADNLRATEGARNPEGLKGGVSGICKAVYTGIGEQKI